MTTQQPEASDTESVARAAQLAAMSLTVLEALSRLRAERLFRRADEDQRAAAAACAERVANHAHARLAWSPALDDAWLRGSGTDELARAWAAATAWTQTDVEARGAADRVERELHVRHPAAMAAYQSARAAGLDPQTAMRQAAPLFDSPLAIEAAAPVPNSGPLLDRPPPRGPADHAAEGYPFATGCTGPKAQGPRASTDLVSPGPIQTVQARTR